MYVPAVFALADQARAFALMRAYNFALLVTAADGSPQAAHLPFLLDETRGAQGTLLAHVARANPIWRGFAALDDDALVIFQGPHAYISPRCYPPGDHVPTWNYLAVHAYGRPSIIEDDGAVAATLERLVTAHEGAADPAWSLAGQDESYLRRMRRGIVAFEIPVARLEAKAKLSQNKDAATQASVIARLETSEDETARALAASMRDLLLNDPPAT